MKRIGYIYEKIYDIENLKLAHKNARKDKTFYKEVQMVDKDESKYLGEIRRSLKDKEYKVSPYSKLTINDKGKERVLHKLPYYPDRIIQWAIMLQIDDIFIKTFTTFTCASIPKRGIHRATKLLDKYLKDEIGTKYTLKIDIKKFYPSIDHEILKSLLRRKLKDSDLLELLDSIVDSMDGKKGVPIGSYLSQYLANFYLNYFDHWLKHSKKCKYVIRYMDDVVILGKNKEGLCDLLLEMNKYLSENLLLDIKGNYQIFPTKTRGVDFVGYRHFGDYKLLRKKTCKGFKKKMKVIKTKEIDYSDFCSVNSYKGWLMWCDSFRLSLKYILPIQFKIDNYLKNN